MIFRGTRDGFKSIDFCNKCYNKSPILIIIKSEMGRIFGGCIDFSEINFNNTGDSFLFSLRDNLNFVKVMHRKNCRDYRYSEFLIKWSDYNKWLQS